MHSAVNQTNCMHERTEYISWNAIFYSFGCARACVSFGWDVYFYWRSNPFAVQHFTALTHWHIHFFFLTVFSPSFRRSKLMRHTDTNWSVKEICNSHECNMRKRNDCVYHIELECVMRRATICHELANECRCNANFWWRLCDINANASHTLTSLIHTRALVVIAIDQNDCQRWCSIPVTSKPPSLSPHYNAAAPILLSNILRSISFWVISIHRISTTQTQRKNTKKSS